MPLAQLMVGSGTQGRVQRAPFEPATPMKPRRVGSELAQYGLMVTDMPRAQDRSGVMSILGTTGVRISQTTLRSPTPGRKALHRSATASMTRQSWSTASPAIASDRPAAATCGSGPNRR